MKVARWRQPILGRVIKRAAQMLLVPAREIVLGQTHATYEYRTSPSALPPSGFIYMEDGGFLLRINEVGARGNDHSYVLSQLRTGDTITVGPQTAQITGPAVGNSGVWSVPVNLWPLLADDLYNVSVARP